jgi:predicted DNA binding CopG/RHH family protein
MRYYCIEFNPIKNTHTMARKNLETNINIRLNLDDMNVLKKQAEKLRVPISTYCRTKLTQDINPELIPNENFIKDAI